MSRKGSKEAERRAIHKSERKQRERLAKELLVREQTARNAQRRAERASWLSNEAGSANDTTLTPTPEKTVALDSLRDILRNTLNKRFEAFIDFLIVFLPTILNRRKGKVIIFRGQKHPSSFVFTAKAKSELHDGQIIGRVMPMRKKANGLPLPHEVLVWSGTDGDGQVIARARSRIR